MEKTVSLHLTPQQIKKLQANRVFQISAEQMSEPANVTLSLRKTDYTRLMSNQRQGKGFRVAVNMAQIVDSAVVDGGRISFKKIGRSIKKGASKLAKRTAFAVGDAAALQGRRAVGLDVRSKKQMMGKVRQAQGKAIRDLKDAGIEAATGMTSTVIGTAAAAAGTKVGGPLGGMVAAKFAEEYIANPLNKKIAKSIDGAGFKKFVKGSQEARDHMARIRAMRKGGVAKAVKNS